MRLSVFLLLGLLALLLGPGEVFPQKKRKGGKNILPDPLAAAETFGNGKKEIVVADVTEKQVRKFLKRVAKAAGVKAAKLTPADYQRGLKALRTRQFEKKPPDPAKLAAKYAAWEGKVEAAFRRLDRNGDGRLTEEEMPKALRKEWRQWDANHDGAIDLAEYRAWSAGRKERKLLKRYRQAVVPPPPEEKKSPVYRAGKLPKGLPRWFQPLDADNDGQIGLYEWLKAGRRVEDFQALDRDGDGFLTIKEILRARKLGKVTDQLPPWKGR
jgi:Ca2+-binding EF-hand superfamily protein